jgi:hypothetical protein
MRNPFCPPFAKQLHACLAAADRIDNRDFRWSSAELQGSSKHDADFVDGLPLPSLRSGLNARDQFAQERLAVSRGKIRECGGFGQIKTSLPLPL